LSNHASRAASIGLAAVVLCLAAFSIVAAYATQTQVERARHFEELHDSYSTANAALLADEASQLEGLVLPSEQHTADRADANGAVVAAFDAIAAQGGPEDVQLAHDLTRLHEQYLRVYASLATANAAGDQLEVLRLHGVEDPLFVAMRERITVATDARLAEAESAFGALRDTSRWILIVAPVVFLLGFALLFGLWRVLERYHDATRKTYREIEQLSRLRGEFVATVSHEFRTPLTGIQGFSEVMRDEELTIPEMREYAGDINKDARRLARLISDMLDLDQMESGLMTANLASVDLNGVIVETVAQLRSNGEHAIELDLDHTLPSLWADSDRLAQVVTNLLSNAIKYSPSGGSIELRTQRNGKTVMFTVRDHGIGIPAEQLEQIFTRYARVETTATQQIKGVGLGLAIVRQIVQLLQGTVWATSTLGEGSTFHVRLPLLDPVTTVPSGAPSARARA
jgi:signal transduction histidine kinase